MLQVEIGSVKNISEKGKSPRSEERRGERGSGVFLPGDLFSCEIFIQLVSGFLLHAIELLHAKVASPLFFSSLESCR
jgi:hypothetical protein